MSNIGVSYWIAKVTLVVLFCWPIYAVVWFVFELLLDELLSALLWSVESVVVAVVLSTKALEVVVLSTVGLVVEVLSTIALAAVVLLSAVLFKEPSEIISEVELVELLLPVPLSI